MRIRTLRTLPWLSAAILVSSCGHRESHDNETIIFRNTSGQVLTKGDLFKTDGVLNWTVSGGSPVSVRARDLHEQGRILGEKGDYAGSIATLKQASQLAPDWPYPVYDMAYTYLLMGQDTDAMENYERVEQMDPSGFFTTKTALWALRGEKAGKYPRGTYLSYLKIEWAKEDTKKKSLAKEILDVCPDYAPAWKEFALATDDAEQQLNAFDRGLAVSPDAETLGMLTINKALFLRSQGQDKQLLETLGELALSTNSTRTTAALAKAALASVIESR